MVAVTSYPMDDLSANLLSAIGSATFEISEKTRRLIECHRPENYTETVLSRLKRRLGIEPADVRSWEWVSSP